MSEYYPIQESIIQTKKNILKLWENYEKLDKIPFSSRITSIAFTPGLNCRFAVSDGHCAKMYRSSSMVLYRKISGFTHRITSLGLRSDAKLLAGGDELGFLRVCTTDKMTSHLRKFEAHKGSITKCSFSLDNIHLFSLGSDSIIKLWDVAMGTELTSFKLGTCKEPSQAFHIARRDANLIFAGNHDGMIFKFDIRMPKEASKIKTAAPVTSLVVNKDDEYIVSASGYNINAWNLANLRQHPVLSSNDDWKDDGVRRHLKFITDLTIVSHPNEIEGEVILSSGLDKLVRVTKLSDFQDLHQFKTISPVLTIGASSSCDRILAGCENGDLNIWSLPEIALVVGISEAKNIVDDIKSNLETNDYLESKDDMGQPGGVDPKILELASEFSGKGLLSVLKKDADYGVKSHKWFEKPVDHTRSGPSNWNNIKFKPPLIHEDTEISRLHFDEFSIVRGQLTKVDKLLRKFKHAEALFESLRINWKQPGREKKRNKMRKGETILIKRNIIPDNLLAVSTVRELYRRGTLHSAVAGRTDDEKERIFRFICSNIWKPSCEPSCMLLLITMLNVYDPDQLIYLKGFKAVHNLLIMAQNNSSLLDEIVDKITSPSQLNSSEGSSEENKSIKILTNEKLSAKSVDEKEKPTTLLKHTESERTELKRAVPMSHKSIKNNLADISPKLSKSASPIKNGNISLMNTHRKSQRIRRLLPLDEESLPPNKRSK